ncbi:MAG: hypothetical protein Q4F65_12050 [Propionibacteriaceae bacterium]|nr:hypothetical protein [Propionibacteriaceae bacterium]
MRAAVEADLITHGLRLRHTGDTTDRLSWHDLGVFIRHAPRGSAIHRWADPEGHGWSTAEYLQAAQLDALNAGNWQRGGKGPRPDPVPRPNTKPTTAQPAADEVINPGDGQSGHFHAEAVTIAELDAWLTATTHP